METGPVQELMVGVGANQPSIHHPLHHYRHGCRCEDCENMNRVYEAMKKRGHGGGVWIRHDGILETRYPELVIAWIQARGRFG